MVAVTQTPHPRFLLSLLGDVSSMLRELTVRLRDLQSVAKAERQCDVVGGAQPSIEWHVHAALASSETFAYRLLLYWSGEAWVIEADTRRFHAGTSALEDEFAPKICEAGALESDLLAAAAALVRTGPSDSHGW